MGMFDDVLENVGKPFTGTKGFGRGTHEVLIGEAKAVEKNTVKMSDAPVIEVSVFDPNDEGKQATCTLYFHTEGGAKMSVAKVLGILVHNQPEEKKDAVRELGKKLFGSITEAGKSRDVALKLLNEKLIGKKAYLLAEPRGTYPTTSYGDLWHYAAEPRVEAKPAAAAQDEAINLNDIPDFGEV